jgi:hypothetical protein
MAECPREEWLMQCVLDVHGGEAEEIGSSHWQR